MPKALWGLPANQKRKELLGTDVALEVIEPQGRLRYTDRVIDLACVVWRVTCTHIADDAGCLASVQLLLFLIQCGAYQHCTTLVRLQAAVLVHTSR